MQGAQQLVESDTIRSIVESCLWTIAVRDEASRTNGLTVASLSDLFSAASAQSRQILIGL